MFAATLVMGSTVIGVLIHRLMYENIVKNEQTTAEILAASIVHDIKYGLDRENRGTVPNVIAKYMTYYRTVTRISYYDADGEITADSDRTRIGTGTDDPVILAAVTRARPAVEVTSSEWEQLRIRSVSPILKGSYIEGAVVMEVTIDDLAETLARVDQQILLIVVFSVAATSILLFFLLRSMFLVRLRRLIRLTQHIASGNYDVAVADTRRDELGQLALAFDRMTADLRRSKEDLDQHHKHLEAAVTQATSKANQAYDDLKNAQGQLILNEKMASLGVLIAGVAHEINTPVGAILNVSRNLAAKLRAFPAIVEHLAGQGSLSVEAMVSCLEDLIAASRDATGMAGYQEIRAIEAMFQARGIDDAREMASTLARLNLTDPVLVEKHLEALSVPSFLEFAESIGSIVQATRVSEASSQKIMEIVRALKYYAYSDSTKFEQIQLNESIRTALVLLRNQLKDVATVEVVLADGLPVVTCTSEIHQIWTNLLTNALDAIAAMGTDHAGRISIRTAAESDHVVVTVEDNGVGIPPEHQDKIYDPFFTTKDIGAGTGLGLSIVSGIVKKHRGSVWVRSEKGSTSFAVVLPVSSESQSRADSGEYSREALNALLRKSA